MGGSLIHDSETLDLEEVFGELEDIAEDARRDQYLRDAMASALDTWEREFN